jgi:DNA-binding NarL/FixJ family response regulator
MGGLLLTTIVFAPPGPLRQELLAFLKSIPGLNLANTASDLDELQQAMQQCSPQLLILAGSLSFTPVAEVLAQLKRDATPVPCLVLVENRQQIQQAAMAGADLILLKGFSTQEFLAALAHVTKGNL